VTGLPQPKNLDARVIGYSLKAGEAKNALHLSRTLKIDVLLLDTKYYPALRDFFQQVKASDEEQIVLQPGATSANS
jgi:hypothetical protein